MTKKYQDSVSSTRFVGYKVSTGEFLKITTEAYGDEYNGGTYYKASWVKEVDQASQPVHRDDMRTYLYRSGLTCKDADLSDLDYRIIPVIIETESTREYSFELPK